MLKIEPEQIKRLNPHQLAEVVRMLVQMEVNHQRLTDVNYAVPSDIYTPDGGEDGFVDLNENVCFNRRFGSSKAFFQLKASNVFQKADFKKDLYIDAEQTNLKPMISERIKNGFTFVWFVTGVNQTVNEQNKIIDTIQESICLFPNMPKNIGVRIYDSEKIAGWINEYSGAIVNTLSILQQLGDFDNSIRTWRDLNQRKEYADEYHWNEFLSERKKSIIDFVLGKLNHLRIKGKSGLGKTKLLIESLKEEKLNSFSIKENILYVDKYQLDKALTLCNTIIRSGSKNAILILDNFSLNDHVQLIRAIDMADGYTSSQIKTISIDFDDSVESTSIVEISIQSEDLKSIIPLFLQRFIDQKMITTNQSKQIELFCDGYPLLAKVLVDQISCGAASIGVIDGERSDLVDLLIFGRNKPSDTNPVLKTLGLISLFLYVEMNSVTKHPIIEWTKALFNVNEEDCYAFIEKLEKDRILDRFGNKVQVRPLPLAKTLAGKLLSSMSPIKSKELINLIENNNLEDQFVQAFNYYSEAPWASDWVQKTMTYWDDAPSDLEHPRNFGQTQQILSVKGSLLLGSFALANPTAVMDLIHPRIKALSSINLKKLDQKVRRNLVNLLDRMAFKKETFTKAIDCLFNFSTNETESFSNNATGILKEKFAWSNAGTEVDYRTRINALNSLKPESDGEFLLIGMCLIQSMNEHNFRVVRAEIHSGVKEDPIFQPKLWSEVFEYWTWCNDNLLRIMGNKQSIAPELFSKQSQHVRTMINNRQFNIVDRLLEYWLNNSNIVDISGLIEQINNFKKYDFKSILKERTNPNARPKIRSLIQYVKKWEKTITSNDEFELNTYLLGNIQIWDESNSYYDALPKKINSLVDKLILKGKNEFLIEIGKRCFQIKYKRAYELGLAIAIRNKGACEAILEYGLEQVVHATKINDLNFGFAFGAINSKNTLIDVSGWKQKYIQLIKVEHQEYVSEFACRTMLDEADLSLISHLYTSGAFDARYIRCLAYGSVLEGVPTQALIEFMNSIFKFNSQSASVLSEIYHMVLFSAKEERADPILQNLGNSILTNKYFWHTINSGNEIPYNFGQMIQGAARNMPQPQFVEVLLTDLFSLFNTKPISNFQFNNGLMSVIDDYIIPNFPEHLLDKILQQFESEEPKASYFELSQIFGVHQGNFGIYQNRVTRIDARIVFKTFHKASNEYLCDFLGHCIPIFSVDERSEEPKRVENHKYDLDYCVIMLGNEWPDEFYHGLKINCYSYGWSGESSKYYESIVDSLQRIREKLDPQFIKSHMQIDLLQNDMQLHFEQEQFKEKANNWLNRME